MRYAQMVIGPAGSGKSTYCNAIVQHAQAVKRTVHVINLDPAAEQFSYEPLVDIRELIQVQDVMEDEELHFGPNGGLVYCIKYLVDNLEWLREQMGEIDEDYFIFDCPGQIELYIHLTSIQKLIQELISWDIKVCCVYLFDSQQVTDSPKFISGSMAALSAMLNLGVPHINIISKMDLLSKQYKRQLEKFLIPDRHSLLGDIEVKFPLLNQKYKHLTYVLSQVIEDAALLQYKPLNLNDEQNILDIMLTIDVLLLQHGEEHDCKPKDFEEADES